LNFFRAPFFLPWIYPDLIWRIPCVEKEIYLTFDDGPIPGPTDFVLETLKKYNCKATFFCIGDNVRKYPEVFKKIREEAHVIGNHTFNHLKGWSTPLAKYVENVKQFDEQVRMENGESKIELFRPPYGRITRSQIRSLKAYKIIMWDVLTIDYNKNVSPEACFKNSVAATRPGSIVVFHDSLKAERNMTYALPRFIEYFLDQGYVFKTITT
jgi:peptidoglycan/xylan/chitin deacetylase (PgdA/CDA1 family)